MAPAVVWQPLGASAHSRAGAAGKRNLFQLGLLVSYRPLATISIITQSKQKTVRTRLSGASRFNGASLYSSSRQPCNWLQQ